MNVCLSASNLLHFVYNILRLCKVIGVIENLPLGLKYFDYVDQDIIHTQRAHTWILVICVRCSLICMHKEKHLLSFHKRAVRNTYFKNTR